MVYGYMKHNELAQMQREKLDSTRRWVLMQKVNTDELDIDLAKILASNSTSYRGKYLKEAHELASSMANMHWFNPSPEILYDFQFNHAQPFWIKTASYLGYLLDDRAETLTNVQRQNLLEMREFTLKTSSAMQQIIEKVMYGPHLNEVPTEELSRQITSLTNKFDSYPAFGSHEPLYNEYLYKLNPYQPYDQVHVFKNDKRMHKEELQLKVESFMSQLWKDQRGVQINQSGAGESNEFGEILDFLGSGNDKKMLYEVQISVAGGHILRVQQPENRPNKADNGKMSTEEAINLSQSLVKRWGEAPLVIDHTFTKGTLLYVTFVPQVGGVPVTDASVEVSIDTAKGILQYFDMTNYYLKRNRIVKMKVGVQPEIALKQINDELEVLDQPKLMIHREKLVYSIPVKGYERVTKVYVDAQTGKQVDIEYENYGG
jgi:hypothetical protein